MCHVPLNSIDLNVELQSNGIEIIENVQSSRYERQSYHFLYSLAHLCLKRHDFHFDRFSLLSLSSSQPPLDIVCHAMTKHHTDVMRICSQSRCMCDGIFSQILHRTWRIQPIVIIWAPSQYYLHLFAKVSACSMPRALVLYVAQKTSIIQF